MHTHPRALALSLLLLTALIGALGACQEEEPPPEPKVEPPLVPVQLPSIPADLGQSVNPSKLPDGSLTLEGLRRDRLAWLDKEIQLSGILVHVYDCPYDDEKKPRRRKGEEPDPNEPVCQRPHFYVADTATAKTEDRLLVVGVSNDLEERIQKGDLKVGERYVLRGTYADLGAGFVAPDQGLLVLGVVVGFEPKEKP
jgi:hypothetical protein